MTTLDRCYYVIVNGFLKQTMNKETYKIIVTVYIAATRYWPIPKYYDEDTYDTHAHTKNRAHPHMTQIIKNT